MNDEALTNWEVHIGTVVTFTICHYIQPIGREGAYPSTPLVINQPI